MVPRNTQQKLIVRGVGVGDGDCDGGVAVAVVAVGNGIAVVFPTQLISRI